MMVRSVITALYPGHHGVMPEARVGADTEWNWTHCLHTLMPLVDSLLDSVGTSQDTNPGDDQELPGDTTSVPKDVTSTAAQDWQT